LNHVLEARFTGLRYENEVPESLARLKIPNVGAALGSSARLTNPALVRALNGKFRGPVSITFGGQRHYWEAYLELQGTVTKGQLEGRSMVTLAENGNVFSNSSSNGSQTGYRELPSDPYAVLLQASPTVTFQLYYLHDLDQLAGNVYRREAEDRPYAYVGTVELRRI
jgi:hypothetical protein